MSIRSILEDCGFEPKEADVYVALVKLGETPAARVAAATALKRPTVYLVLERLHKRGLVTSVKKGGRTFFRALHPSVLIEDADRRLSSLQEAVPKLERLMTVTNAQPQVRMYEGKNGLIRIMEDTLTASTELLCWADITLATKTVLEDYYPTYIRKKVARKLWVRAIVSYDPVAVEFKRRGEAELREIYMIPKEKFPFKNEINIYDDKVAVISHVDALGVIIQNPNIADTQRSIFKLAFQYAPMEEERLLRRLK